MASYIRMIHPTQTVFIAPDNRATWEAEGYTYAPEPIYPPNPNAVQPPKQPDT